MAHSPSQKWEDGKLVERAQDARGAVEENEAAAVTGRPVKKAPPNSTFTSRREARLAAAKGADSKAVEDDEAENKAVSRAQRKGRKTQA